MYININTQTTHSEQDIRNIHSNVSFPNPFVAPAEYSYIFPAPVVYNSVTQVATQATPEQTVLGHWEQRWIITDKTTEQVEAEAEAARVASIPRSVTRRQARQALVLANKFDLVQTAINAIPDILQRKLMQIEWDDSQEFERNRPSLVAIGAAIGLTPEGVDDLFRTAATL